MRNNEGYTFYFLDKAKPITKRKAVPNFTLRRPNLLKIYSTDKLFGIANCAHFADYSNFNLTWVSHFILNAFGNIKR